MITNRKSLRPAVLAAALGALLGPLWATTAHAGNVTLSGDRLALTTTGDIGISIETENGLGAAVRLVGDDLSCLNARNGQVVTVSTEGCGNDLSHLTIMVPPGFPMSLSVQGSGDVRIGDVGGTLDATLNGDGGLSAGRTQSLMLAIHGDGDATVTMIQGSADIRLGASGSAKLGNVQGVLHAALTGSGDLTIAGINAPAADVSTDGSGEVSIGDGDIKALRAATHGSGDVTVSAHVTAADLEASGGGDIKVRDVSGVVKRHSSGGSSIEVGGTGMDMETLHNLHIPAIPPIPPIPAIPSIPSINIDNDNWPHQQTHHSSDAGHIVAGILVLVLAYFIWRTVQRNGGWQSLRGRASAPSEATHPGVLAVRDTLTRLDGRLAQVELYVTSREFDLQRKFRELEK
jgi:hypothetical protein